MLEDNKYYYIRLEPFQHIPYGYIIGTSYKHPFFANATKGFGIVQCINDENVILNGRCYTNVLSPSSVEWRFLDHLFSTPSSLILILYINNCIPHIENRVWVDVNIYAVALQIITRGTAFTITPSILKMMN